jgi:uncharacterized protein (DUF2336 family)
MGHDETALVRLGAGAHTAADAVRLAADPRVTVRAALALNPTTSAETDTVLAHDPDERVREMIARKLIALAPSLSASTLGRLRHETLETLTALAEDEAVRVRVAIAEAVKDLPDAPRAIVLRLAHDKCVMVCEPVILFSPLLDDDDLVSLATSAPSGGTRFAVARRRALSAKVGDALVQHGSDDVVLALLKNASAQIREATLDALAERSATHPDWHGPLVRRPALSARSAKILAPITCWRYWPPEVTSIRVWRAKSGRACWRGFGNRPKRGWLEPRRSVRSRRMCSTRRWKARR